MSKNNLPLQNDTEPSNKVGIYRCDTYLPSHGYARNVGSKSETWNEIKMAFAGIGIRDHTIDSLAIIPLVEIAFDDKCMTFAEKEQVLSVMQDMRLLTTGIDLKLQDLWLPFKGRTEFLIVWTVYVRELRKQLTPGENILLKTLTLESCSFMIQILGEFLRVKNLEQRMLIAIDSAFAYD